MLGQWWLLSNQECAVVVLRRMLKTERVVFQRGMLTSKSTDTDAREKIDFVVRNDDDVVHEDEASSN